MLYIYMSLFDRWWEWPTTNYITELVVAPKFYKESKIMSNTNKHGIEIEDKFINGYVNISLSNVECHWCHLFSPDTAFGNNKYSVEMRLEDELAGQLKQLGFDIKDKVKDGEVVAKNVLKAKREVVLKSGKKQGPPSVVGPDGRTPFTEEIGNGAILNLNLSCRAWPINGSMQLSAYVDEVQVVSNQARGKGFGDVSGDSGDTPRF